MCGHRSLIFFPLQLTKDFIERARDVFVASPLQSKWSFQVLRALPREESFQIHRTDNDLQRLGSDV
jgi:hypothetical protein